MTSSLFSMALRHEHDVVAARQRARRVAEILGFDRQDQSRVATAVSEIARNAYAYAGGGLVEFAIEGTASPQVLLVRIGDDGPGIRELDAILAGQYRSRTGMGMGILGARRLMDQFHIQSGAPGGTRVELRKLFPRGVAPLSSDAVRRLRDALAAERDESPLGEIQRQNQELLRALDELRRREVELIRLNGELEDTNRGVVALYAELDEKADHLRRADDLKSRFLSNMTHEFRTPVNSILGLSRLLLERLDGDLTPEQEKQVGFIRKAAEGLSELVNDLLDLAKVEAGKVVVRPVEFDVASLFGALRGMLRPLLLNESVRLVFDDTLDLLPLHTDEGKVSQILRNFISNALKFTERGEIRVSARSLPEEDAVVFAVSDTGIGIAEEDRESIFQEFTQVESPVQKRVKGTGLGLPLTRRLAELLGGRVLVESRVGVGSTFSAIIPRVYRSASGAEPEHQWQHDPSRVPVLVIEDDVEMLLTYERFFQGTDYQAIPARHLRAAEHALRSIRPSAIVLDISLFGEPAWSFLAEMKSNPPTAELPILVVSTSDESRKGIGLGADAYAVKPIDRAWLLAKLDVLTGRAAEHRILVIDDEEIARYLLKQMLAGPRSVVLESEDAERGLRRAREEHPDAIFLDLVMPGIGGAAALAALKADVATRDIPVVIITSKALEADEQRRLAAQAVAIVPKHASRDVVTAALAQALAGRGVEATAGT